MRRFRSIIAVGMAATFVISSAGCSNQAPQGTMAATAAESKDTAPQADTQSDDTSVSVDTFDWRQFEGQEIVLATYLGTEADYLESLLPEFYDLTGITVSIEQYPEEQLYQNIQLDTSSRTGNIDCFTMDMMRIAEFAKADYIAKVQDYLDNPELTNVEWYDKDDILAGPMSAAKYNDILYGIPSTGETSIMFYRKDIFEEKGVDVPKTFDELWDVCAKIDDPAGTRAIGLRGLRGSGMNIYTWTQFFRGFGGAFFKDFPTDMTPTINTPEAVKAVEYYAGILQKFGPSDVAGYTNLDIQNAQMSGAIAITMDANVFGAIVEDTKTSSTAGKWGYAMVPSGEGGCWPSIYSHIMCINNYSSSKEAAWLFIEWATSPEITLKRGLETGVPARKSTWESDEFINKMKYIGDGTYTEVCKQALDAADASYRPVFENWNEMGDYIGIALQDVISSGSTDGAQAALDNAQSQIENMLKSKGYIN